MAQRGVKAGSEGNDTWAKLSRLIADWISSLQRLQGRRQVRCEGRLQLELGAVGRVS